MCYSTSPRKRKLCPLHQNFNIIQYFVLIGPFYIEMTTGSYNFKVKTPCSITSRKRPPPVGDPAPWLCIFSGRLRVVIGFL